MIDKQTDRQTDIMIDRQTERQTNRETQRRIATMINGHTDKHTDIMINGNTFVGEGIEVGINNVICKQGFRSGTTLPTSTRARPADTKVRAYGVFTPPFPLTH